MHFIINSVEKHFLGFTKYELVSLNSKIMKRQKDKETVEILID